jgi:hypothetical protein
MWTNNSIRRVFAWKDGIVSSPAARATVTLGLYLQRFFTSFSVSGDDIGIIRRDLSLK